MIGMRLLSRLRNSEDYEKIFIAAWGCYIFTYPGRFGFGAAIAAISLAEGYTAAELGLVASALFAAYGIGQMFGGVLGDRCNPAALVSIGFFGCAGANLMMALSGSLGVMMAAWILNGLFCSLIWAPLVRLLTIVIPGEMLNKAMLNMQYCTAFGNVLTFLLVALITALMPWRAAFFIIAALVLLAGVVWTWTLRRCEPHRGAAPVPVRTTPAASRDTAKEAFVKSGFIFILLLTLYMGFLKDGIQTWVPKAITDIFGTTPALSVFLTAALPLINTIGVFAVKLMQRWKKEEDLLYTAILFGGAGVILALVAVLLEVSAVLTVALFSLASAGVFGVSTALTYLLPVKFARYGRSSTVAGLSNAFTYLGSALSGVGIGLLVGGFSWAVVCLLLCGLCAIGTLLSLFIRPTWNRFIARGREQAERESDGADKAVPAAAAAQQG